MTTTRKYVKVVLLGEMSCGKTCLVKQYFKNEFNEREQETIGSAFESKIFTIDSIEYQMNVWDTTGQERFRAVCALYYRGAQAAILCYDVRCLKSFLKLDYWLNELRNYEPNCRIYLCATKADLLSDELDASPKFEFVKSFAKEYTAKFYVTSAKDNLNVDVLFNEIFEDSVFTFKQTQKDCIIKLPTNSKRWKKRTKNCCSDG